MTHSTHENFDRAVEIGSDRSFGIVMAVALCFIAILNAWHSGALWPWMGGIAALFLTAALFRPTMLSPLNRAWSKFGLLLHKVVNPIVMGVVFYGAVLPTGLVMRARGKDLLQLKRQPNVDSYWIVRQPPGPAPDTMKNQF